MNNSIRAKLQFLASVKANNPALYRAALRGSNSSGLSGLGETVEQMLARQDAFAEPKTSGGWAWLDKILTAGIDVITKTAPVIVGTQQALACVKINAERAKIGQSPIDCASGGLAPQIGVGISPDVKYILWGALAIGAAFLLMKKR